MAPRSGEDKACWYARDEPQAAIREATVMKRIHETRQPRPVRRPEPQDLRTPSGRPMPY
ncbi:hypothetical protein AB0I00_20895 [Streptomyces sp. NPDC050803]|uniref:hypothetical protein n=1 Tax=unclassified Streptomyces TaxID=2593676 RepID=UPI003423BFDF